MTNRSTVNTMNMMSTMNKMRYGKYMSTVKYVRHRVNLSNRNDMMNLSNTNARTIMNIVKISKSTRMTMIIYEFDWSSRTSMINVIKWICSSNQHSTNMIGVNKWTMCRDRKYNKFLYGY